MKLALLVLLLCVSPFAQPSNEFPYPSASFYPAPQNPSSEMPTPEGGRLWVPAPPLETPSIPYGAAPPPKFGSLYEQLRTPSGSNQTERPSWASPPYDWQEPETQFFEGYRFRRLERDREADEGIWYQGYRFRPLTERERARMRAQPGWRPWEERPQRQRRLPSLRPEEGSLPGQEDWFQRYFGR